MSKDGSCAWIFSSESNKNLRSCFGARCSFKLPAFSITESFYEREADAVAAGFFLYVIQSGAIIGEADEIFSCFYDEISFFNMRKGVANDVMAEDDEAFLVTVDNENLFGTDVNL